MPFHYDNVRVETVLKGYVFLFSSNSFTIQRAKFENIDLKYIGLPSLDRRLLDMFKATCFSFLWLHIFLDEL